MDDWENSTLSKINFIFKANLLIINSVILICWLVNTIYFSNHLNTFQEITHIFKIVNNKLYSSDRNMIQIHSLPDMTKLGTINCPGWLRHVINFDDKVIIEAENSQGSQIFDTKTYELVNTFKIRITHIKISGDN